MTSEPSAIEAANIAARASELTALLAFIAGLATATIAAIVAIRGRWLDEAIQKRVDAAKGEIERDLKTHEVRLRIDAEFRLRMLERMLTDVADFRSKLGAAIGAITLLTHEVVPHGDKGEHAEGLLRDALKAFAALSGAGPVMPPDLRAKATDLANKFEDALRDVVIWSRLPSPEERRARCMQTDENMAEMGKESHALFGGWLAARFDGTLRAIERESVTQVTAVPPRSGT